jgi:NitT/TauT family transport system substrate-binding protein
VTYRTQRTIHAAAIAVLLIALAVPAWAQGIKKVRTGEVAPIALFWPGMIAHKQKFYEREGLDVEQNFVGTVGGIVQQVIAGSLDFGFTTAETALRAVDKGADVVIIGETVIKWPYSIMVQKDIRTAADLKGKKVMLPTPRQGFSMIWYRWLKEQGVDPKSMDDVFDGATPNRYAALVNGAVAATTLSQPQDFMALQAGYKQLVDFALTKQDYSFVVIVTTRKILKEQPDTVRAFLRAIAKATEWWYDPANKEAAINVLHDYSKADRAIVVQTYEYYFDKVKTPYSRNAAIFTVGEQGLINLLADDGAISDRNPARYIDASFLPK